MEEAAPLAMNGPELPDNKGEKKKEGKKDLTLDKMELSLYRAQLSVLRTAATLTTLGFALHRLIEERIHDGANRPLLRVFTPRIVALCLFFSGFLGLATYSVRHVVQLRKIGRFQTSFYYSGVMLVSYVILLLTFLLFMGTLING